MGQAMATKSKTVAKITEGVTDFILLEHMDGDRSIVDVNSQVTRHLQNVAAMSNLVPHVSEVMRLAYKGLRDKFADDVSAVADQTMIHDGQVVIRVQPAGGKFNIDLSRRLNDFSWELQDTLCELAEADEPPMLFGFRQEFPGGEEECD